MSFNSTPFKSRPPPGEQGSTPFRSTSASRFRSSLVPTSRPSPARSLNPSTKITKTSTGARDLFRTSNPSSNHTRTFSPDLPADVTRPTLGVRKFAPAKSVSSGMAGTSSTDPFKMRIPTPDPDLTGEAISKEIPNDPTRTGTVYTDQFLAHKCPPHFDDLQRRQFFCILDLRRLKYAADEIFAKKDWKLNILNFAKEYEKSRGMIMLRYGLYEFKNVKPSEETLKKWRTAHGLSDPQPQGSNGHAGAHGLGSTKRKAEEELSPKDNTLMASSTNQNKRRSFAPLSKDPALKGPAPFKKSKRKVDDDGELDENQPSKKPASAATSKFESILNSTQRAASPLKPPPQTPSLFGVPNATQSSNFASKANPFQPSNPDVLFGSGRTDATGGASGSVLSSHKIGSTPTTNAGNIFSYLSESSANNSGNENGDADEDDDSKSEQEGDSEEQEASAAVSTGTSTPPVPTGPLFAPAKTSAPPNLFGAAPKSDDLASKGGLFGRIQMGSNGQPVKATLTVEEKSAEVVPASVTKEQHIKTPAKAPGDYTFNPATTPISFGQPAATESSKIHTQTTEKPASLFGLPKSASSGLKPASTVFGSSNISGSKAADASHSIFSPQKSTTAAPSMFSQPESSTPAASSLFNPQKKAEEPSDKKQAGSMFHKPAVGVSTPAEPKELFATSFGKEASKPAATGKPTSIFGQDFIKKAASQNPTPAASSPSMFSRSSNPLFAGAKPDADPATKTPPTINGQNATQQPATTMFGNMNSDQSKEKEQVTQKPTPPTSTASPSIFGVPAGSSSTATSTPSIFGEKKTDSTPATSNMFGGLKKPDSTPASTNIFGPKKLDSTPATSNLFGATKSETTGPAMSSFGAKKPEPTTGTPSIFGTQKPNETAKTTTSIFSTNQSAGAPAYTFGSQPLSNGNTQASSVTLGASTTSSPTVSFGASLSQPNGNEPKKPGFAFGSSATGGNGNEPKKPDTSFGSATTGASTSFTFGQNTPSGGFTFSAGGDGNKAVNNPFTASQPNSQPSAPSFGGISSTPTPSSSFNFSFGQPAASTPSAPPPAQSGNLFGGLGNTNGAPSFNFTQATPGQSQSSMNGSQPSAAPSVFGSLQAGSFGAASTGSPFPAPSSMGTTPVNGTPEPQTANGEDGEAPQEQISLTSGGPGEEDETLVHEVRAKAIKYVPVKKDDEEQENKSPWSTQGVGPLRVLKNKTTGAVRMLLRAEPRGHVVLNKTILPDVGHTAKAKTVNFVASSDDGSGLETWVLQVKTPESASELARVLEENKVANKK